MEEAAAADVDAELLADASVGASATAPGMASERLGVGSRAAGSEARERVASALGLHRNRKSAIRQAVGSRTAGPEAFSFSSHFISSLIEK